MSTRVNVLNCWLEGSFISSLAALLNEDPRGIEEALRMELKAIQEEAAAGTDCTLRTNFISTTKIQPLTKAEAVPEQGPAPKARPDHSSSRPRRFRPTSVQQRILGYLKSGAMTVSEMDAILGVADGVSYGLLSELRRLSLVERDAERPAVWRLAAARSKD